MRIRRRDLPVATTLYERKPKTAPRAILTLELLRRHNSLDPQLQPTHRYFLRWAEPGPSGAGPPDPDAPPQETHFDPLPPDVHEVVSELVDAAPARMRLLIRRWYRSQCDTQEIMDELGVKRTKLYGEHRTALWYFRGCFEAKGFDVRS